MFVLSGSYSYHEKRFDGKKISIPPPHTSLNNATFLRFPSTTSINSRNGTV